MTKQVKIILQLEENRDAALKKDKHTIEDLLNGILGHPR